MGRRAQTLSAQVWRLAAGLAEERLQADHSDLQEKNLPVSSSTAKPSSSPTASRPNSRFSTIKTRASSTSSNDGPTALPDASCGQD